MWNYKPKQPLSADDISTISDTLSASPHVSQIFVEMDMRKVYIVMMSYTTKTKDDVYARLAELQRTFAGSPLISYDIVPWLLGRHLKDGDSDAVMCWSRGSS